MCIRDRDGATALVVSAVLEVFAARRFCLRGRGWKLARSCLTLPVVPLASEVFESFVIRLFLRGPHNSMPPRVSTYTRAC